MVVVAATAVALVGGSAFVAPNVGMQAPQQHLQSAAGIEWETVDEPTEAPSTRRALGFGAVLGLAAALLAAPAAQAVENGSAKVINGRKGKYGSEDTTWDTKFDTQGNSSKLLSGVDGKKFDFAVKPQRGASEAELKALEGGALKAPSVAAAASASKP
eukprot:CAMPEP_0203966810 /NCGR_PEP_ID=MMETSP0359-20131031/95943_1 /ASSEMBLY_ACC=CAM_ASM_000338 /TAXON_ID=268821 /ORGANISM="Scrippsiella Hangoei, Strain SHTV-5" /LENGTH=157 /DNA_ID=CAMNT_0050904357 /DNA_START=85 /DNA_END=558 /DNA_ORIENTATION=+